MIETIKARRLMIDRLMVFAEEYKFSAETTLAFRSLQMAKGRLGLVLRDFGQATPYKVVDGATDIPPTSDTYERPDQKNPTYDISGNEGKLYFLNEQREGIANVIEDTKNLVSTPNVIKCVEHLEDARMWYGFALGVLREKALKESREENQGSCYNVVEKSN